MHRNRSVNVHRFAMTPRAEIPRASFNIQKTHKTTFDSGVLVPLYVDEVLPGDTFSLRMTAFTRLATPLFPVMDNLHLDTFFFFVPNRLVWKNWVKLMGEQDAPGDTTDYAVPQVASQIGGFPVGSVADYFGVPNKGQIAPGNITRVSALPFRAYNLIWNEWFRDENLENPATVNTGDTEDVATDYPMRRRGKRHDYFTSCLPWPQKGPSVKLPLGTAAPVKLYDAAVNSSAMRVQDASTAAAPTNGNLESNTGVIRAQAGNNLVIDPRGRLYADLSQSTAATINELRQSFQIQKLLERDARGGTRYTEIIRSHFGVMSPDARLQRPEYLGGGSTPIIVNPIAQTSATGQDGSQTPMGTLAAMGTGLASNHGFSASFVEHGHVIGLAMVRADLTYQQGLRKMWTRRTRVDFYFPAFAMLGEQAVLNQEIYQVGDQEQDEAVFGYQERWAEYRYNPSQITGLFRSTAEGTLDAWHLAQRFDTLPTLAATFIQERPPVDRVLAVGAAADGQQFLCDAFFSIKAARPMPLYSVPGLIDHF